MRPRFKLKISTYDNEPIVRAKAERLEDLEPVFKGIKEKFKGRK